MMTKKLVRWSELWLLRFHPDKCIYMNIGKQILLDERTYSMGDHILNKSPCEKDIGVFIDENLNFEKHIHYAVKKANKIVAIIRKTFDHMDADIFKQLFKSLVRPHLEYGAPVWSPHTIKNKELIENVQRRATKTIPGFSNLSYPERLRKLKLPTLAYRRIRGDMIQVYKLVSGGYDESLKPLLKPSTTNLRGHEKKLYVRGNNKDVRKYNFSLRVERIWNSLPEEVIKSKDVISFEKSLDNHWGDQEIMYDNFKAEIKLSTH